MDTHLDPSRAAASLDEVARARRAVAQRVTSTRWYHPTAALLLGAFVTLQALDGWHYVAGWAALLGGTLVLQQAHRHVTGVTVDERDWYGGRGLLASLVVLVGATVLSQVLWHGTGSAVGPVVAGVLCAAGLLLLGRAADASLLRRAG